MTSNIDKAILDLGLQFAHAQEAGDLEALESLLTDDFKLVGPLGFVLDKHQWLGQYRSGALKIHSVRWEDVDVRDYANVAVAIGRYAQQAEYQGNPVPGLFRVTQIAVEQDGEWRIGGLHFSPIAER
jgi:hypothetical protein